MATAFAALVSLQNNLRLIGNHPRHSFSFEYEQIESLWISVRFLIMFMKSFNDFHGAIKEAAEALERRIARAAQAAEDVIESHVVDQIRSGSTLGGKTRSRFLLDLQKAIDDIDFVFRKAANVLISQLPMFSASAATTSSTSLTVGSAESNRMVGFDDELHRLLDLLIGEPSSLRVIIPIVGMGGIGKTTLATNAFQHPFIVQYFDFCLWATVSQDYSVHKILTQLLSSLLSQKKEKGSFLSKISTSVDELGEELYKSLFGRRYLIILDDMWSVEAWDTMKFFFPDTSYGSRIVVTTRQSDVARHFGPLHLRVKFLDEESSWDLFCSKTFGEEGCPHELEDIGKKIVGKCGGLPLAIVVVGGHLRKSSRTPEYWESVANYMNSVLDSDDQNESCLNILSLSYRYLPVHLKPCFLFLGVFADRQIPWSDIVKLWVAEGFLEHYKDCSLEDVALDYLNDLVQRNLILVTHHLAIDGKVGMLRIHDLLRELCLKIAKKDEFLYVLNTPRAITKEHRILINGRIPEVDHQQKIFHAPRSQPLVRSLMCEGGQLSFDLRLLRVLNKVDIKFVNEFDFRQVNLRYLKVNVDCVSCLPPSISLLWNLQTLIITGAVRSIIAPYEIWEMLQLRHIAVDSNICLPDPLPIESLDQENDLVLRNLQTLSGVLNFRLSEEVCRRIPYIKTLALVYQDKPSSNYCLHNLGCFQELKSLQCYFVANAKCRDFALGLTFPSSLRELSLCGSRLDWEDLTMMVGSLPYLENLVLFKHSVIGSVWTPAEGGFPCLKELVIHGSDLIDWNAEESHFPVLEDVVFMGLSKLDEFPPCIGEIPTLKKIVLIECSMSSTFSAMRMVVEQEKQGIEGPQLRVKFKGDEETLEGFKQKVEEEGLTSQNIHLELENVKTTISLIDLL